MIRAKETLYVLLGPFVGTSHRGQYEQDLGCEWNGPLSDERLPESGEHRKVGVKLDA